MLINCSFCCLSMACRGRQTPAQLSAWLIMLLHTLPNLLSCESALVCQSQALQWKFCQSARLCHVEQSWSMF